MSSRLKLAGICFAAAFGLAACGGGGSPLDTARAERDQLAEQLAQAIAARDAAQAQVATLTGQVTDLTGQVTDLTGQLGTANTDLETARTDLQNAIDQGVTDQEEIDRLTQAVTDAEGMRDSIQGQLDTANENLRTANAALMAANAVNGLFATAQSSRSDADAAVTATGNAVDNAVKYAGMLDVASVKGNSTMAAANAQAVLDAAEDAAQAVRDAEAAQMAAEGALASAMALDDSATKTGLVAALEAAVAYAKAQVTAAEAAHNKNPVVDPDADPVVPTPATDSLAEAVAAVTGGENADPQTTPKTIGERVAMAIGGALLPQADLEETTPDGTAARVNNYATSGTLTGATPPAIKDRTFHAHNSMGMTWEGIVGAAAMDVRRLVGGSITQVKAMSVMGSMASDLATDPTALPADTDTATDGIQNADGNSFTAAYMGIGGTVFCAGADCGRSADGDLTGSWYFTPDSATTIFIANSDGTGYMADTGYVQWGHWLAVDAGTGDVTVHTYATTEANVANLNVGVATGCAVECSASYSGSAAGMSVQKTFDGNGKQLTIDSGAFTASVELTAEFGTSPMLGGRIWNFQGGAHTDSSWSVTLEKTAIGHSAGIANAETVTGGVAKGSGQAGDWAARAYGPAQTPEDTTTDPTTPAVNHRPSGFFGNFNAHFTDGHAAGVFVAD